MSKKFDYSLDFEGLDFSKNPQLYRIGKGEQGVLLVKPYKHDFIEPLSERRNHILLEQQIQEDEIEEFFQLTLSEFLNQTFHEEHKKFFSYKRAKHDHNFQYHLVKKYLRTLIEGSCSPYTVEFLPASKFLNFIPGVTKLSELKVHMVSEFVENINLNLEGFTLYFREELIKFDLFEFYLE